MTERDGFHQRLLGLEDMLAAGLLRLPRSEQMVFRSPPSSSEPPWVQRLFDRRLQRDRMIPIPRIERRGCTDDMHQMLDDLERTGVVLAPQPRWLGIDWAGER